MTKNRLKNFFPSSFFRFWEGIYLSKSNSDFKITEFFSKVGCNCKEIIIFFMREQMCTYGNLVKCSKKGDNFDQINFESILV